MAKPTYLTLAIIRKCLLSLLVLEGIVSVGCRSMSSELRPVTQSRTFYAATAIDSEPDVLTITLHAPTHRLNFSSPSALTWSLVPVSIKGYFNFISQEQFQRTFGIHTVGHATIELKWKEEDQPTSRYLLTSVTDAERRETVRRLWLEQIGFSITTLGTRGKLESPEKVARDIDESAELGIQAARMRFLLPAGAAKKMQAFFEEFHRQRVYERFVLTGDPIMGTGAGCTALAVSFLRAADLLDPSWAYEWQRVLDVPCELMGDPTTDTRVPLRRVLFAPVSWRWANPSEPHHSVVFYDTQKMYDWIIKHRSTPRDQLPPNFSHSTPVECLLEQHLNLPIITIDLRNTNPQGASLIPQRASSIP